MPINLLVLRHVTGHPEFFSGQDKGQASWTENLALAANFYTWEGALSCRGAHGAAAVIPYGLAQRLVLALGAPGKVSGSGSTGPIAETDGQADGPGHPGSVGGRVEAQEQSYHPTPPPVPKGPETPPTFAADFKGSERKEHDEAVRKCRIHTLREYDKRAACEEIGRQHTRMNAANDALWLSTFYRELVAQDLPPDLLRSIFVRHASFMEEVRMGRHPTYHADDDGDDEPYDPGVEGPGAEHG